MEKLVTSRKKKCLKTKQQVKVTYSVSSTQSERCQGYKVAVLSYWITEVESPLIIAVTDIISGS